MNHFPKYWNIFLKKYNLEGVEINIPEEIDLSEIGANFKLLSESEAFKEQSNLYPGLIVKNQNYIQIGNCTLGSGDPYFININDGSNGKLYRIYHDEVFDNNYDKNSAIDIVTNTYIEIMNFKT